MILQLGRIIYCLALLLPYSHFFRMVIKLTYYFKHLPDVFLSYVNGEIMRFATYPQLLMVLDRVCGFNIKLITTRRGLPFTVSYLPLEPEAT